MSSRAPLAGAQAQGHAGRSGARVSLVPSAEAKSRTWSPPNRANRPLFLHRNPARDSPSPPHSLTPPTPPVPTRSPPRWPLAPPPAQSVLRHFEDLHADHIRHGPEASTLRRELALLPVPAPAKGMAGPIRHRRRRSRIQAAYTLVGLRSRVEVLVAMEGWDGDSSSESQAESTVGLWSLQQQRRKLERRVEHLQTSECSLQEEVEKLRTHNESFELEKTKLSVLQQTLEIETAQLKQSHQALASQHSLLQERLGSVGKLKQKLESAHEQLKRNYEYATRCSEKIVRNLRRGDRLKLQAQFAKKRGLSEACRAQVHNIKSTLTALAKEADAKKENIDALKTELEDTSRFEVSPTKRQAMLKTIRDTLQNTPTSRPTSPRALEIVSDVALSKTLLDAQLQREQEYDVRFSQIRATLGASSASASSAVSSARKELDRWRNTVAISTARKAVTRKPSRPTLSGLQSFFLP